MVFVSPPSPLQATVSSLPPSAKLVYTVLAWSGQLTQKALIERTALPSRTVRYALRRLRDERLIIERLHLQDARQSLYAAVIRDA
jgi:transcription initiation factor IIE alpha subunit